LLAWRRIPPLQPLPNSSRQSLARATLKLIISDRGGELTLEQLSYIRFYWILMDLSVGGETGGQAFAGCGSYTSGASPNSGTSDTLDEAKAAIAASYEPALAEKQNDLGEGAIVVQAYVKLVDCIATHRDPRTTSQPENRADIRQDSKAASIGSLPKQETDTTTGRTCGVR
jgi:hypothetical protein